MSNLTSLSYYIPELIIIISILMVIVLDVIPLFKQYTYHLSLGAILLAGIFLWQTYLDKQQFYPPWELRIIFFC